MAKLQWHLEETRSLVGLVPPRRVGPARGVKRGRPAAKSGEWRPSLSSISEDNVLYERNQREGAVAASAGSPSERNLKRKVTSTPKSRSRYTAEEDYTGRTTIQAVMPAFSPAPFMF